MAESTLSLQYTDLQLVVGRFLGYKRDVAEWPENEVAEVDEYIQAGVRQFYYPPAMDGIQLGYEWSFLRPVTTIVTKSAYATGSLAVVSNVCTLTGGTWPTWAYTHGKLVIDETTYTITARTSDTVLAVTGDDVTAAQDGWSLSHNGIQDMPDNFGRMVGDLHFEPSVYAHSITIIGEGQILSLRQRDDTVSRPRHAALRFKTSDGSDGQRQEIVLWPRPNEDYTLTYRYEAYVGKLTETYKYVLGGMKYAEVVTESCLAVAEQRANDEKGLHWDAFVRALATAVAQDRKAGARYYGAMSYGETTETDPRDRRNRQSTYDYYYNGVLI